MNEPTHLSAGPHRHMDEQTIGFQGRHKGKQKIKFKREEDGFIADCHCDNGFACSFHFRNMPPPTKHVRLTLISLHSRLVDLFNALNGINHKY